MISKIYGDVPLTFFLAQPSRNQSLNIWAAAFEETLPLFTTLSHSIILSYVTLRKYCQVAS